MREESNVLSSCEDGCHFLLSPQKLGPFQLSHRVVLAPVTRCRALNYVPQQAHIEYYSQRTTPGGLLITEAVAVSQEGIGFPHSPGIFTVEQVEAWKRVVDAVHRLGGIIFCQLWHVGRASHTFYQPNGAKPISSTSHKVPKGLSIKLPDGECSEYSSPRALETTEISKIVDQFRKAARNARLAGFDGVEIHAAHGYLVDQFLKDGINDRTDEYGGSIENRCRFGLEVVSAIADEIGSDRTAIRISPIIDHLGAIDSDPITLGLHLVEKLNRLKLAYLHLTEPRFTSEGVTETPDDCSIFRNAYRGVVMTSGGYTRESGEEAIRTGYTHLVAYGRLFISNPDLPVRFALEAKLNKYDRSTFYTHDQMKGYVDYPSLSVKEITEHDVGRSKMRRVEKKRPPVLSIAKEMVRQNSCGRSSDASNWQTPRTPICNWHTPRTPIC
eukprot:c29143_g1_i3 orf=527-1849(-)